jgi:hypothetical protein
LTARFRTVNESIPPEKITTTFCDMGFASL